MPSPAARSTTATGCRPPGPWPRRSAWPGPPSWPPTRSSPRPGSWSPARAAPPTWSAEPATRHEPARSAPYYLAPPARDFLPLPLRPRGRPLRSPMTCGLASPARQPPPDLRDQLTGHLRRARGLAVDPADIFLFPSVSNALRAVAVTCGLAGQPVAFEDPGYAKARLALSEAGAVIRPVPVDD